MSLFESFLELQLGPKSSASVTFSEEGHPTVRVSLEGVPLAGSLVLEPEYVVLDGDFDEEAEASLMASVGSFGNKLRRIHDLLDRFPAQARRGDTEAVVYLTPPTSSPMWSDDGLWATVCVAISVGGSVSNTVEEERLIATRATLDAGDWEARLAAFDARRAQWEARFEDLGQLPPEEASLEIPEPPPEDDGWSAYAGRLALDTDALAARVDPGIAAAFASLAEVRARYKEIYGLKLPAGLAALAALVTALGALPENPEEHYWQPAPGWERGNAWLDRALGMRVGGLLEWFAPGGLARGVRDASALYAVVPPGCQGPLDARLDMRYRRDAPQFVTFLSGDSDGLHWGFWYDDPEHFPVVASNYARDDADTTLAAEEAILSWLRGRIARSVEQVQEELKSAGDEDSRGHALRTWRALRVVEAHFGVVEEQAAKYGAEDELLCPWPRMQERPVGSPPLAMRPEAGTVPAHVPRFGACDDGPYPAQLAAWMEEARRELEAGRPAYAHALGIYLHWLDLDELRKEAGDLLLHAYAALGFLPFAGILKVHLLHRDLPSVAVFAEKAAS